MEVVITGFLECYVSFRMTTSSIEIASPLMNIIVSFFCGLSLGHWKVSTTQILMCFSGTRWRFLTCYSGTRMKMEPALLENWLQSCSLLHFHVHENCIPSPIALSRQSSIKTHSASACLPIDVTSVSHEREGTNPNGSIEVLASYTKIGEKTEKRNRANGSLTTKNTENHRTAPLDFGVLYRSKIFFFMCSFCGLCYLDWGLRNG